MSVTIAFAPELNIDVGNFMQQWNASDYAGEYGELEAAPLAPVDYMEPELLMLVFSSMIGIGTNLLTEAIKEFLKQQFDPDAGVPAYEIREVQRGEETILVLQPHK